MSSHPPCSRPRLHHSHPTLDIQTQDHLVEVTGTFKGFHVRAIYVLDWHGLCPVNWDVRNSHEHTHTHTRKWTIYLRT